MATDDDTTSLGCCAPMDNHAADGSSVLKDIDSEETPADVAAIRAAGFTLLLETGQPVTTEALIAATGIPADRVAEIFASMRSRGRVEFDDENHLIGLAGLTLTPGRHELTIDGATRWTWCALDAVGILGALMATGTVRSTDPHTGYAIEIPFVEGRPDTDAHLFILGGFSEGNVREDWCSQVNFFTNRSAADEWVSERGLEGDVVAVADIVEEAATMWQPVVDIDAPRAC